MKKLAPVVLLLLAVALIGWLLKGRFPAPADPNSTSTPATNATGGDVVDYSSGGGQVAGNSTPDQGPPPPTDSEGYQILEVDLLDGFGSDGRTPQEDIEQVVGLISSYHTLVKGNRGSWGENRELAKILTGENSHRLRLISPDHPALNDSGELVDRWGTPIFFHALSAEVIEVRMAGPDRAMYTGDDLFYGEAPAEDLEESVEGR